MLLPCLNFFIWPELYAAQWHALDELLAAVLALQSNNPPPPRSLANVKTKRAKEEDDNDFDPQASPREIVRRRLMRRVARLRMTAGGTPTSPPPATRSLAFD
jgi:hypothetical protein